MVRVLRSVARIRAYGKVLAIGFAGAGVLVVLCLLALPLLVPSAELRHAATAAITAATGQAPVISGEPTVRLLPSPRVLLGKVSFPLPAGQTLDAEDVVTRLRLWPLIAGRAEVADVTLQRPTLVLTRNGDAAPPVARSARGPAPAAPLSQLGQSTLLKAAAAMLPLMAKSDLPDLRVVDGTIAVRSPSGLTEELIGGIVASLDRSGNRSGISLAVDLHWRDRPVSIALLVDDTRNFLAGTAVPTRFTLASDGSNLRFRGNAALGDRPEADGMLSAETPSLRQLLEWVGTTAPLQNGFGATNLSARIGLEGATLTLADARIELDGNRGEGALLMQLSGGRPLIQGTLAADSFSLDPYGRIQLMNAHGSGWNRAPIDLALLDAFDLDLRLSAGQVSGERSVFTTVAASAVLSAGRMVLAVGQANGWGGLIRASATLTAPGRLNTGTMPYGAGIQADADLTDVDLEKALDDIAGLKRLEGQGTLQIDLKGEGHSIYDIAQNLSGSVQLTGDGGYLVGFDVPQALQRIERRPLAGGVDVRGGRTAYTQLNARIAGRNGTADLQQIEIEGRQIRVFMAGTAAVAPREFDLSGRAMLLGPPLRDPPAAPPADADGPTGRVGERGEKRRAATLDLPFTVRGSWDNPSIMVDPQSLLERSGAAQSLMDAVRRRTDAVLNPVNGAPATPPPAAAAPN